MVGLVEEDGHATQCCRVLRVLPGRIVLGLERALGSWVRVQRAEHRNPIQSTPYLPPWNTLFLTDPQRFKQLQCQSVAFIQNFSLVQGGGEFGASKFSLWEIPRRLPKKGVENFADNPRNVVVCRALRAQWSLARGATHNAGETHLPHCASDEGQIVGAWAPP